jgi:CheY-like chemotaxis protein/HPt (histidine-containing phosphotransfer) domain-containing protein
VAEDYEANRKVVMQMLRLMGCQVDAVENGREAVRAMDQGSYDLVLMDVQMPDMDGLTATAEIRRRETARGRRTPILAYTAHAMEEDQRRCLEVGMDGYLTKPLRQRELSEAIATWASRGPDRRCGPAAVSEADRGYDDLAQLFTGDEPSLHELVRSFLLSAAARVAGIERALAARDADAAMAEAHRLKGLSLSIGAGSLADGCTRLREAGRRGDWPAVETALVGLRERWVEVEAALARRLSPARSGG